MGKYRTVIDNTPNVRSVARNLYCRCSSLTILSPPSDLNFFFFPKSVCFSIQKILRPSARVSLSMPHNVAVYRRFAHKSLTNRSENMNTGTMNTDEINMLNQFKPVATHSGRKKSTLNVNASRYLPMLSTGPGHSMSMLSEREKNCSDSTIFFKLFVACAPMSCEALKPKKAMTTTTAAAPNS